MYIAHKTNGMIGELTGSNQEITELYYKLERDIPGWKVITKSNYEKRSAAIDKSVARAKAAVSK